MRTRTEAPGHSGGTTDRDDNAGFDSAVDWLLDQVDMETTHRFWLLAHGEITEDGANRLDREEIGERWESRRDT